MSIRITGLCCVLPFLTQCSWWNSADTPPSAPPATIEKTLDTRIFPVLDNPELLVIDPDSTGRTISVPSAKSYRADHYPAISGNIALPLPVDRNDDALEWNEAEIGDGHAYDQLPPTLPAFNPSMIAASDSHGVISVHPAAVIDKTRWKYGHPEDGVRAPAHVLLKETVLFAASGNSVIARRVSDGKLLWKRILSVPIQGQPAATEDAIYVTAGDNQLWALDRHRGSILWHYRGLKSLAQRRGSAEPVIFGKQVIMAFSSGEVVALNRYTGRVRWRQEVGHARRTSAANSLNDIDAAPRIIGDKAYIISSAHKFICLDLKSGMRLWEKEVSGLQAPWVVGDYIFVVDMHRRLLAFDRHSGQGIWQAVLPGNEDSPKHWFGPVVVNGYLLLTGDRGKMLVLRPENGNIVARHDIPDDVRTAPMIAHNQLYLYGKDATLYIAAPDE